MSAASDDRMVLALSKFSKGKGKAKYAIDQAVKRGIYKERIVMCGKDEDGKPMKISQIKVSEEIQNNDVSGCITEKIRGGCSASAADAMALMQSCFVGGQERDGLPIENDSRLAIEDGTLAVKDGSSNKEDEDDEDNEYDEDDEAEDSTEVKDVKKRPAASMADSVKKRPCTHIVAEAAESDAPTAEAPGAASPDAPALTDDALETKAKESEAQNAQLNKCLEAALAVLSKQELENKRLTARIGTYEIAENKKRIVNVYLEELTKLTADVENAHERVKHLSLTSSDVQFVNSKIDALETAHSAIADSKEISLSLKKTLGNLENDASKASTKATKA